MQIAAVYVKNHTKSTNIFRTKIEFLSAKHR